MPGRPVYIALALVSAALLAFQIILLQAFSTTQWYHFAYMVISVALLGFGASGTVLTVGRSWFEDHYDQVLPAGLTLSGLTMPLALAATQLPPARFDSYLLLSDVDQLGALVLTYVSLAIPFFFGALVIGLTFVKFTRSMGGLYFANLVGSGAGGVLGILLLYISTPETLAGVCGLVAVAGAAPLLPRERRRAYAAAWLAAAFAVLVLTLRPVPLQPSEYKDIQRALLMPGVEAERAHPHPQGIFQILTSDLFRHAPDLSLAYSGEVPAQDALFINGDAARSLGTSLDTRLRSYSTAALPFLLVSPDRALILGGVRPDAISQALERGASVVVAAEPHAGVRAELLRRPYRNRYPVLFDARLQIRADEARSILANTAESFDLIYLKDVGSFSGSSGLFALQEEHHLTLEAFDDMWAKLSPGGAIAVRVWMDHPPRAILRMVAMLATLLERAGAEQPANHLVAIRSWGAVTVVARKRAVGGEAVAAVRSWAEEMLFDPLILPGRQRSERGSHHALQDTTLFASIDSLLFGNREALYRGYPFRIEPATENRPYFSQFLRWGHLRELKAVVGAGRVAHYELGTLIVGATFIQVFFVALLLIVLPLARLGWKGARRGWTLLYFGGLAVGFMFVEIVMIQRFTLYFGYPMLAVSFVFTVLLIMSGVGSMWSSRLRAGLRSLHFATGAVAVGIGLLVVIGALIMNGTLGASTGLKLAIGAAVLGPVSFAMGIPFPLGLRFLGGESPAQVPWAWAINGCISVVAAPGAILLAAELGATTVLLTAAAAYGAVALGTLVVALAVR